MKNILYIIGISILLFSCGQSNENVDSNQQDSEEKGGAKITFRTSNTATIPNNLKYIDTCLTPFKYRIRKNGKDFLSVSVFSGVEDWSSYLSTGGYENKGKYKINQNFKYDNGFEGIGYSSIDVEGKVSKIENYIFGIKNPNGNFVIVTPWYNADKEKALEIIQNISFENPNISNAGINIDLESNNLNCECFKREERVYYNENSFLVVGDYYEGELFDYEKWGFNVDMIIEDNIKVIDTLRLKNGFLLANYKYHEDDEDTILSAAKIISDDKRILIESKDGFTASKIEYQEIIHFLESIE